MSNELIVFAQDNIGATEPVEIGKTDRLSFTAMDGSKFRWGFTNVASQRILLEGWKAPAPPFITGNQEEVRQKLCAVIAALVNMMGGAVTVQSSELHSFRPEQLVMTKMLDPWMLLIKLDEDDQ